MFQTLLHCRRLLCITCSRLRLYWNSKVKSFCFSLCPEDVWVSVQKFRIVFERLPYRHLTLTLWKAQLWIITWRLTTGMEENKITTIFFFALSRHFFVEPLMALLWAFRLIIFNRSICRNSADLQTRWQEITRRWGTYTCAIYGKVYLQSWILLRRYPVTRRSEKWIKLLPHSTPRVRFSLRSLQKFRMLWVVVATTVTTSDDDAPVGGMY